MAKKQRAFIYTRTSGVVGKQNAGMGARAQLKDCRDFCKTNKLEVVQEFFDNGVSGREYQKSYQLMEMLDRLNEADVVVSKSGCRLFGRDKMRILLVKRALKKSGKKVMLTDTPNFDLFSDDPHDFLIQELMEVLDQWERMTISGKLAKGRYNRHLTGRKSSGSYPLGYTYDADKNVIKNPKTAPIVEWLFKTYNPDNKKTSLAGLSAQSEILWGDVLNNSNKTAHKGRHKGRLSPSGIRSILLNKFYIGYVKHGREAMVEGKHEPLITKNRFTRVNKMLLKNTDKPTKAEKEAEKEYVKTGLEIKYASMTPEEVKESIQASNDRINQIRERALAEQNKLKKKDSN